MIKIFLLISVFFISIMIGLMMAAKFRNREKELKEMKSAISIMKTKIQYTYEPIPQIFEDLSHTDNIAISNLFQTAKMKMKTESVEESWEKSINETPTSLKEEDKVVLKGLGKLLGKTDVEGQLSQITLTTQFLDTQIEKAEKEKEKNEKLYKTLGFVIGCTIVIILI